MEDDLTLAAAGSGRVHQQTVHPAAVGFHVVHRHVVAAAVDFTLAAAAALLGRRQTFAYNGNESLKNNSSNRHFNE